MRGIESVEDFAALSAQLADPFADRRTILAQAALEEAEWEAARRAYGARLSAAATAPRGAPDADLCTRFRVAFELERAERRAASAPPTSHVVTPASAAPSPSAPPPTAPSPSPPAATPSYLHKDAAPPRGLPSHLVSGPPPSAPPAPLPPPIAIGVSFAAPPVAPPPVLAIGVPLAAAKPRASLDGTALLSGPLPGVREAAQLPFKSGGVEPPKLPTQAPRSSISTGTRMAPEGMPIHSVPFESARRAEGNLTGWTVERYAALCIDLSLAGRPRPDVLRDYGLDEARFGPLDSYWEGAVAKDAALQQKWTEACARRRLALGR